MTPIAILPRLLHAKSLKKKHFKVSFWLVQELFLLAGYCVHFRFFSLGTSNYLPPVEGRGGRDGRLEDLFSGGKGGGQSSSTENKGGTIENWDQYYQYLSNCPPTPPLTQH